MKKILFLSLATFIVASSLIFVSWQKKPTDDLAAKVSKSKNYIAAENALDIMQKEMKFNHQKNRAILRKHKRSTAQYVINDKFLSQQDKTDSLAKMGIVRSPEYKLKSLEFGNAMSNLYKEFPELNKLDRSERKKIFSEARKLKN